MSSIITRQTAANDSDDDSSSWSDDDDDNKANQIVKPLTDQELFKMQQTALNSDWILKVPMVKWSNQQLEAWASTLTSTDLEKKTMSKSFSGNKMLNCKNHREIMKLLGIPENDAKELFEEIKFQQKVEKEKKYSSKFAVSKWNQNKNQTNNDSKRWKTRLIKKWTVEQTIEWIKSLKINKKDEKEVIHKLSECEFDGETIIGFLGNNGVMELSCALDIKPSVATIIYMAAESVLKKDMLKTKDMDNDDQKTGRKTLSPLQTQYRNRNINKVRYPHIVLSNDPDIIMKYDNNDGILRAKMPGCGHAIAAETMYFYIKSIFEKYQSATEILCPDPKCRKQWDWSYCVAVADMNDVEMLYWNKERQERMASTNFRKCPNPNCGIMCSKPDNLGTLKVRCSCSSVDWCWLCRGKWISSSLRVCGNSDCKMIKEINETLAKADLFEPMGLTGKQIKIPELRACPICMTIVHHIKENDKYGHHCKHVSCPVCKPTLRFCFVCLGIYDSKKGGWPCGGYTTACKPHGIQKFQ